MAPTIFGGMDSKNFQAGATTGIGSLALLLPTWRKTAPSKVEEERYQGGEAYADPKKVVTGIIDDLKSMGSPKKIIENIGILLDLVKENGLPVDDRKLLVLRSEGLSKCEAKRFVDGKDDRPDGLIARDIQK